MRVLPWIAIALLMASPVLAQEEEGGEFFGGFSAADAEVPRDGGGEPRGGAPQEPHPPNPVDQLDVILSKGGAPLSVAQKQAIQAKLDAQLEALQQTQQQTASPAPGAPTGNQRAAGNQGPLAPGGSSAVQAREAGQFPAAGGAGRGSGTVGAGGFRGRNPDQSRRQEEQFIANFLPLLTPEQTTVWKTFERQQIRARGGYPALKLALEDAGTPPAPEQEVQMQEAFRTYDQRQRELRREAGPGGTPDAAKMKEAENLYLTSLLKALNAEQRKALIEWRHNSPPQAP